MLKRRAITSLLPVLAVGVVLAGAFLAPSRTPFGGVLAACVGYGYGYGYSGPVVPTVSGVSPNSGTTSGGTTVFITGSGFCDITSAVNYGATAAASFAILSDTSIKSTSPAHAAGTVDVTVTNAGGTSATSSADQYTFVAQVPSVYTALTPQRVRDTRTDGGTLSQGGSLTITLGGIYVPANATAVVLNVTATNTSKASFFTVYPTGNSLPTASNLNWIAGETVPNLVEVGLGTGGNVTIYNGAGTADAVVDLEGYFAPPGGASTAGEFVPVVPARITDTRAGSGSPNAGSKLGAGATLDVQVTGTGGIPFAGVDSVVLNVTAVNQTATSFFTVFPTGTSRPTASNLNWTPGDTVPNRVIVPAGNGGKVSIFNAAGAADVVVDVNGYFTDQHASGASFTAVVPARIKDTRTGPGPTGKLGAGATSTLTVAGAGGVPGSGATAVIINVTVANPTTASFLTVYPTGASRPVASDLNFIAGQAVPNLVVVKLSAGGQINIFNAAGSTNVIVDVVGWFG